MDDYLTLVVIGGIGLLIYSPLLFFALLSTEIFVTKGKISGFPLKSLGKCLVKPKNAIKEKSLEQEPFICLVNRYYPDLKLNTEGCCYGLLILWYLHYLCKKDFNAKSNGIVTQIYDGVSLSQKQLELLEDIANVQEQQRAIIYITDQNQRRKIKFSANLFGTKFSEGYENFAIIKATNAAISNPDELIKLSPMSEESSHAIGLIASYADNKYEFEIFDSNFHEATFDSSEATQAGLSRIVSVYTTLPETAIFRFSLQEKFGLFFWKRASCLSPISITPNDELQTENLRGMLTA